MYYSEYVIDHVQIHVGPFRDTSVFIVSSQSRITLKLGFLTSKR